MDPDIFEIFYSAIIKNQPPIVPLKPRDTRVTPYRSAHYTHCLDRFFGLVELITEIKDAYKQYYTAKNDTDIQKKNFLIISELQRRIRELDDNIKLFLIMRHPQALSDMIK